jgi:DNA repair protein RecO (recombination protein O)
MFVHYRTEGLVIKKEDRGEADRLFTIYTKDFGKLKILGRAIRKIKSKLRGNICPFCLLELEFIQGKTYKTLTDTLLIRDFPEVKKDLRKLKMAYRIADVLDNLIRGEEKDEKVWRLLNETFNTLNNYQIVKLSNWQLVYYFFLWNLFSVLGYAPEFHQCIICQQKLKQEKLYFSAKEGGIVCSACFQKRKITLVLIKPATIKILRLILEKKLSILQRLKIEKPDIKNLRTVSQMLYNYIT